MEIERRWLVDGWPPLTPLSVLEMEQGYFAVRPAIRIRRERVVGGSTAYILCFKGKGGLAREEIELELTQDHYDRLNAMLGKPMIRKEQRRYPLPGGLTLEVNSVPRPGYRLFLCRGGVPTPRPPPCSWAPSGGAGPLSRPGGHRPARGEHGRLLDPHPGIKDSPAGMACGGQSPGVFSFFSSSGGGRTSTRISSTRRWSTLVTVTSRPSGLEPVALLGDAADLLHHPAGDGVGVTLPLDGEQVGTDQSGRRSRRSGNGCPPAS